MKTAAALSIVEEEVRELVRRRGVDPAEVGAAGVSNLVDEVLADYEERRMSSSLPHIEDRLALRKEVLDRVAGLGPLQSLLDDDSIEEIWINGPGKVFCARDGNHILTNVVLTERVVKDLVERMLRTSGRRLGSLIAIRRCHVARRLATSRRNPRHHAPALGGEHPKIRTARPFA